MVISCNVELNSPDRLGLSKVMLRLHAARQLPARITTNISVPDAQKYWALFDPRRDATRPVWGKWVVKHPDAAGFNDRIKAKHAEVEASIRRWQTEQLAQDPDLTHATLTPKQLKIRFDGTVGESYRLLADKALRQMETLSMNTYKCRAKAVRIFLRWAGEGLRLPSVTITLLESFQRYLRDDYISPRHGGRLTKATINSYLDSVRRVHAVALMGQGYSEKQAAKRSPFSELTALKAKSVYRAKFDEAAIAELRTKMPDKHYRNITVDDAFRVWVLLHLLAGMRFGDGMRLRYGFFTLDDQGLPLSLAYTMNKTGNYVDIPVMDEARDLLMHWWKVGRHPDDYVLPYLKNNDIYAPYVGREAERLAPFAARKKLTERVEYLNFVMNGRLKLIETNAKLKVKLRMHNARHSFADLARRIMQEDKSITLLDITRMLGQSDPHMVMRYIEDLEKQDATRPMQAVFRRRKKED